MKPARPLQQRLDTHEQLTVEQHKIILQLRQQVAERGLAYRGVWKEGETYAPGSRRPVEKD